MEVNEAADLLDNLVGMVDDSNEADYDTALRMGIEALRASGDIIYRQAAIDALGDEPEVWTGKDEYAMGLNNQWHYDRNAIKAVPSAQPTEASCWGCNCPKMERLKEQKTFSEMVHLHDAETQWIPCEERLPEWNEHVDGMVLVCYGNGSVRFNTFMMGGWCQGNPIAWMPLPEPYKEKDNERA